MTKNAQYEIVGGEYGPERIVFDTMAEAEVSLSHLQDEYPDVDWVIIEAK